MPISERAKQFMPFSALKGLDEAIAQKERQLAKIKEPGDEQVQRINELLLQLKPHDLVDITLKDKAVSGEIEIFDTALRLMKVDGCQILFDDIYSITKKEKPRD